MGVTRWRDGRRIMVQLAVLLSCCLLAVCARAVLAAGTLGPDAEIALCSLVFTVLAMAFATIVATSRTAVGAAPRIVARVATAGLVAIGSLFAIADYAVASVDLQALIKDAGPDAPVTTIVVGPGGADVRLSGELTLGAAARLDALLDANPGVDRIHLTSEGGLADEGQALGDVIAAHRLVTYVPDYCVSACTLAFVRGRERLMLPESRLGFHAPFEEGLFGVTFQGDSGEQRRAYLAAGVAADFADAALAVAASDLWIPTTDRLIAAKVATGIVETDRFPDSTLDGMADPRSARDQLLRSFTGLRAFERRAPSVLDRLAAAYLQAYERGLSEAAVTKQVKAAVAVAVATTLAQGDDATLVRVAALVAEALPVAAAKGADACAAIGTTGNVLAAAALLRRDDPGAEARADALIAAALANGQRSSTGAVEMNTRLRVGCDALKAVYGATRARPEAQVAAFMRRILDGSATRLSFAPSITQASMAGGGR